jgi:hypothetical protein
MDELADAFAQDLLGEEDTMEDMVEWLKIVRAQQEQAMRAEAQAAQKQTTLEEVVKLIQDGAKVLVMAGAGLSVSAGIPDFRTPGTGLYDNLAKYQLPYPTAIFELSYFKQNPEPFYLLAREMFPGRW